MQPAGGGIMSEPGCGIYLVLPRDAGEAFAGPLEEALAAAEIAGVLLETASGTLRDREIAARFIEIAHRHDVAFLIEDDAEAARDLGADGIHLSGERTGDESAYQLARGILGGDAIIGGDCALSRHRAMVLGERGADYVAFSEAAAAAGSGGASASELISWWSELFQVPCVAWRVAGIGEAEEAARLGADFVALDVDIWKRLSTAPEAIEAIHHHLKIKNAKPRA